MFQSFLAALRFSALAATATMMILWGMERAFPRSPVGRQSQLRSIPYWCLFLVASAATSVSFERASQALGLHRLITVPLAGWIGTTPLWWSVYLIGPLSGIIVYDFFNYWMHRAQHKWFWKQHSIHHSITELSAINSYFHPTEDLFKAVFIAIPMTLVGIDAGTTTLASFIIVGGFGNYLHTASSVNFGRVGRRLLADNVYHRIHHSVQPEHFDKNFATATPIWDILFGTACFSEEWPETGVHDSAEPLTIPDFLLRPFLGDRERLEDTVGGVGGIDHRANANLVD